MPSCSCAELSRRSVPRWTANLKLLKPISVETRILVPEGATIRGRIVRLERHYHFYGQSLRLGIQLEAVMANGGLQTFSSHLDSVVAGDSRMKRMLGSSQRLGSFPQMENPNVAFITFVKAPKNNVIASGLQITGVTAHE